MNKLLTILILSLTAQITLAADFHVPTVSRCLADMSQSNTKDSKVYNIYSDFYYEYSDKRDYAIRAIQEVTQKFSAEDSSCQGFTQPMNRETVQCYKFSGSEVCTVPSDAGEFIVVKDYVDSTNVILTEYSNDYTDFPEINSANDFESLWLPQPELCYTDLLAPIYDSQAHSLNASAFVNFSDFRYVLARSNRDLVKNISENVSSCEYATMDIPAHEMTCISRPNKPAICSVGATGGGYFIYVTDADNTIHMIFNRWD
ncbi:hypothetical protein [Pleionea sediminis]|uniref:hypothetical protein n=1 Tax=Pleionea sediminis TaxID=2569479 RepID=UPI001185C7A4|nr:hypothetical protein [Pleionea sediminis]